MFRGYTMWDQNFCAYDTLMLSFFDRIGMRPIFCIYSPYIKLSRGFRKCAKHYIIARSISIRKHNIGVCYNISIYP